MAKPGPRAKGRPPAGEQGAARSALVAAAVDVLREQGFVGASARTIAGRAGVNSAAVFYHFGSVNGLLLEALDTSTGQRLERYRSATNGVTDIAELIGLTAALNREDHDAGHIAVMTAMVGGAAAIPGLGAAVAERVQPWIELVTAVVERVLAQNPLRGLVEPAVIARAVVALFLGMELMTRLESDNARSQALFDEASKLGALAKAFASTTHGPR